MSIQKQFLWLHIKKSAGTTTRKLLEPYYTTIDRSKKPKIFIQAHKNEYNDILNNDRIPLGDHQFRRALFAKKYLYPNDWANIYSFAFSREPQDRCISMFYYLFWKRTNKNFLKQLIHSTKTSIKYKKLILNHSYAFDVFLDLIQKSQVSPTIYKPLKLHFTTHVNPMWNDVTDEKGEILLTKIFRMENLIEGVNTVFQECNIPKTIPQVVKSHNQNQKRKKFSPSKSQIRIIEEIYKKDFELYESLK